VVIEQRDLPEGSSATTTRFEIPATSGEHAGQSTARDRRGQKGRSRRVRYDPHPSKSLSYIIFSRVLPFLIVVSLGSWIVFSTIGKRNPDPASPLENHLEEVAPTARWVSPPAASPARLHFLPPNEIGSKLQFRLFYAARSHGK